MNVINILNTIRANSSQMYQDRIPTATKENLQEIGGLLVEYKAARNEFVDALINKIAFTIVSNRRYKNPLSILKKGKKPFGTDIEEIFTNPITGEEYDSTTTDDLLTIKKADVKTIYHRSNRRNKYKVSVNIPELKRAFTNEGSFAEFVNSKLNAMYSGDEMDEYMLMRNLFSDAIKKNMLVSYDLNYDGGETSCKELIKLIKTLSANFTFMSRDYNGYNKLNAEGIEGGTITACETWTPSESQMILIRSDVDASTDVEVLAKAFNMDKTEFLSRKIVVDSFGDEDTLCVILDDAFAKIYDELYDVEEFTNGSNLVKTYWLHHWQTISLSLFANAVAIKQTANA